MHFPLNVVKHLSQAAFYHYPHMKQFQPRGPFQTRWRDLECRRISRVGQHWLLAMLLSSDSVLRLALRFLYNCWVGSGAYGGGRYAA